MRLPSLAAGLDLREADAIVLSACVQVPSLAAVSEVERQQGIPVITAATATVHQVLTQLALDPHVPGAGRLLDAGR